jgi:hypothetical protein
MTHNPSSSETRSQRLRETMPRTRDFLSLSRDLLPGCARSADTLTARDEEIDPQRK